MKLGLGTVQFGLDYGITNTRGKPGQGEVSRIIEFAADVGIRVLDTAHAYGESEEVLGHCLPPEHGFDVVTKTLPLRTDRVAAADVQQVIDTFRLSLERLRRPSVHALLVHHVHDVLVPGGERLMAGLGDLKSRGLVKKVGVSVYNQDEIDAVLARFPIDIIQIPFNVLDQRLLKSGTLSRLKRAGVEVHARSVFLQGLLLMEPNSLGDHFLPARDRLGAFREFAQSRSCSPLEAALRFVVGHDEIDCAVVGVTCKKELEEIVSACRPADSAEDYSGFAMHDESILNPARWPR